MNRPRDPKSGVDATLAVCAIALGLFSVVTLIAVGYRNYTRLPWFDAWDHWVRYLRADHWLAFLFSQHNEHRIPVSRLLYLADERWFHADARLLLVCTYLAQLGSAAVLYRLACTAGAARRLDRVYILGIVLAFTFAASQWINFTWTFEVCFVTVFSAALAAFAALKNARAEARAYDSGAEARAYDSGAEARAYDSGTEAPAYGRGAAGLRSNAWVAVAIVMALVSTGSMANGLIVWPLLVVMAACLGLPKKVVVGLAALGVVVVMAYLHGYTTRDPGTPARVWTRKADVVSFALVYLGSAVDEPLMTVGMSLGRNWEAYRVPASALVGLAGVAWFFFLMIASIRDRSRLTPSRIAMLHVLAFLAASSALTAVGRVKFPITDALTSRYVTPSVLFWACLIVCYFSATVGEWGASPVRRYRLRLAALVAAVFVGGVVQLPKVAYAAESERFLAEGEYAIINNVFSIDGWGRFLGATGRMIPVVRYFRARHLASFVPEWTRWIGNPVQARFLVGATDADCSGQWESVSIVEGTYNPAALADGWAYDRRAGRAPDRMVFVDAGGRIVGFAALTRRRPDLVAGHPEVANHRVGWRGYLPASVASDMTAYLMLGDGRSLCRIGDAHVPGNYWTAPAAKAGEAITDVGVRARGEWGKDIRPSGLAAPPYAGSTWSSQALTAGTGDLRLGPLVARDRQGIGLPVATGPGASAVRLSVVDRDTGNVLAAAMPPANARSWDLWRFDVPIGAPDMSIDYLVEQHGGGPDAWVVVGAPRAIRR